MYTYISSSLDRVTTSYTLNDPPKNAYDCIDAYYISSMYQCPINYIHRCVRVCIYIADLSSLLVTREYTIALSKCFKKSFYFAPYL